MNHDEVFHQCGRNGDARDAVRRRRKGGEEGEWQMLHRLSKFGPVGSVPGINRIERLESFERSDASAFHDSHKVETRIRDGSRSVGESD